MNERKVDISIVLGSKNRKGLLRSTIKSIRNNGFTGRLEIIVVDGGSTDGSCSWLAKQKDIFTIIQPNSKIIDKDGVSILKHSWGEFMNIGFKYAKADWIVMVSDDLVLAKGALQKGYDELVKRTQEGERVGGGAFYFKEYPRHNYFRVGVLPNNKITINHGFYYKKALEEINYIDEINYNFYCADGDLIMRMYNCDWDIIPLEESFANHLVHKPSLKNHNLPKATIRDIKFFESKYPQKIEGAPLKKSQKINIETFSFWRYGFLNCILGFLLRINDDYKIIQK